MTEPSPRNEQEQADLVAYLDGELTGEAARTLEAKLSLDPQARAEADALRRTWELLDYLPRPEPSARFTHRTLERLSPVRSDERRAGPAPQPYLAALKALATVRTPALPAVQINVGQEQVHVAG